MAQSVSICKTKRINDNQHALTSLEYCPKKTNKNKTQQNKKPTCVCERGRLFFQGVSCTFYCFGLFTQSEDLVNFCIKKKKKRKTCCASNSPCRLICFSTPPPSFLTLLFPWRSHLGCSVSTETRDLKPDMSRVHHEDRQVKRRRSSRDPSFVILFSSGSKVTEYTIIYYPPSPSTPPHTHTQQ